MKALHQLVPSLQPGDAVSAHALEVRGILREMGLESEIFVEGSHASFRREVEHFEHLGRRVRRRAEHEVGLLYQMAIGSKSADAVTAFPGRRFLNYHNITPARFFRGWDPHEAVVIGVGRRQLRELAAVVEVGIAVSAFNEHELRDAGYRRTEVAPVLFDVDSFDRDVDERALERIEAATGSGAAWLFVGRVVPHKAQHDLVKAFAVFRRTYDPTARLLLVGGPGPKRYVEAVERYIADLGLADAVDVPGRVSQGELAAYYRAADVFVSSSEHEGFGIPLLEAMHHELPVIAYRAAAVPETVGGAGVLLDRKDPVLVAAAVHRLLSDDDLRSRLVAAGKRRLDDFALDRSRARFRTAIEHAVANRREERTA